MDPLYQSQIFFAEDRSSNFSIESQQGGVWLDLRPRLVDFQLFPLQVPILITL